MTTAAGHTPQAHFAAVDPVLAAIAAAAGPCPLGHSSRGSVFEALARSIAGQQLSGAVAARILERLIALHDGHFPTAAELAAADVATLRGVGFSFAKVAALHDLAAHTLDGRLAADAVLAAQDDEAVITQCCSVRGIGRWSAQMLLMFHLGRPDVLPVGDFGVCNGFRLAYGLKGMPQPAALARYGERWGPWRSTAAWTLWRAVDLHRAGTLPVRKSRAPRVALVKAKTQAP